MLFLRSAHSPDCPPLDLNPLPTDYETRALTNAPPGKMVPYIETCGTPHLISCSKEEKWLIGVY